MASATKTATILHMPPRRRVSQSDARIGVIIQARMTSRRFPGKSMALLDGKPVIQHVMERAKLIRAGKNYSNIKVILAVPDTDESEPMIEIASTLDVDNFCGSELNVLERYYQAAMFFKLDYIVRITGDCPLIDPKVSSEVLQLLLWRKCDYTSNIYPDRTYPKGLDTEAFTMDCLEVAYFYSKEVDKKIIETGVKIITEPNNKLISNIHFDKKYKDKKQDKLVSDLEYLREHVTPFMQQHPEIRRALVKQNLNQSQKNWCVDEKHDIPRLERLISQAKLKLEAKNDK